MLRAESYFYRGTRGCGREESPDEWFATGAAVCASASRCAIRGVGRCDGRPRGGRGVARHHVGAGDCWGRHAGAGRRAPGAGQTYDTEFIEDWLYVATAVLAVVLAVLAALLWRPPAFLGLIGVVAALWWGGSETVDGYAESGWSDGLEVFVYIVPITAGLVGFPLLAACSRPGRAGKPRDVRTSCGRILRGPLRKENGGRHA
jgi:hypothetical protein